MFTGIVTDIGKIVELEKRGDLGSGRVCNRWEMAVGFKWMDSQLISRHLSPLPLILMNSVGWVSFPVI